ncbi:hypothetical protein GGR57DRAFT_281470 [Xylariaceae sp. FL1272]|nr:hypothetical protein GGR57DRAFT_281470 [Xylariaceae sp. FL1272]
MSPMAVTAAQITIILSLLETILDHFYTKVLRHRVTQQESKTDQLVISISLECYWCSCHTTKNHQLVSTLPANPMILFVPILACVRACSRLRTGIWETPGETPETHALPILPVSVTRSNI